MRLARLIRASTEARSAAMAGGTDAAIVIEVRGVRVAIGHDADFGVVAMVVAILGAGGAR